MLGDHVTVTGIVLPIYGPLGFSRMQLVNRLLESSCKSFVLLRCLMRDVVLAVLMQHVMIMNKSESEGLGTQRLSKEDVTAAIAEGTFPY